MSCPVSYHDSGQTSASLAMQSLLARAGSLTVDTSASQKRKANMRFEPVGGVAAVDESDEICAICCLGVSPLQAHFAWSKAGDMSQLSPRCGSMCQVTSCSLLRPCQPTPQQTPQYKAKVTSYRLPGSVVPCFLLAQLSVTKVRYKPPVL